MIFFPFILFFPIPCPFAQNRVSQVEDYRNMQELDGQLLLSVIVTEIIYDSHTADNRPGRVLSSLENRVSLIFGGTRR